MINLLSTPSLNLWLSLKANKILFLESERERKKDFHAKRQLDTKAQTGLNDSGAFDCTGYMQQLFQRPMTAFQ